MREVPALPPKPAKPRLEKEIQDEIRSALSPISDVTCFRNNSGRVWLTIEELLRAGIPSPWAEKVVAYCRRKFGNLRFGLGEGSADLIGSVTVRVTLPSGVVTDVPITLAIEVKRPGEKRSDAQERWAAYVRSKAWRVSVCTSAEEALAFVEAVRRGDNGDT
jgi:hypothetical protein